MKIKNIEPGMVIRCKTQDEYDRLMIELDKQGYVWSYVHDECTKMSFYPCMIHTHAESALEDGLRTITYSKIENEKATHEFSDLIIEEEMTTDEVLKIIGKMCNEHKYCEECPIKNARGMSECAIWCGENPDKCIEICQQWKADHSKKPIETEWVDMCRIIKVTGNCKKVVHEIELKYGTIGGTTECEDALREYCQNHNGNYIAVVEQVCRVKGAEHDKQ